MFGVLPLNQGVAKFFEMIHFVSFPKFSEKFWSGFITDLKTMSCGQKNFFAGMAFVMNVAGGA